MRALSSILIIVPFILLVDFMAYRGLLSLLVRKQNRKKKIFPILYWGFSLVSLIGFLSFYVLYEQDPAELIRFHKLMGFNGFFIAQFVPKVVIAVLQLLMDIYNLVFKVVRIRLKSNTEEKEKSSSHQISRRKFIKRTGLILAAIPFIGIIHGIGWGRFNFTLHRKKIYIPSLPDEFEGFKIVQLSDAHLGSLSEHKNKIENVFNQINDIHPDLLVFTGDMVNNFSHEISGWVPVWKKLKARYGKYSVLGNHDYGGYSAWPTPQAKRKNLQDIIRQQREMGFVVLMNESLPIQKNGKVINLLGVENWGKPPFPQYGKLEKAMEGIDENQVTILLSHDPDHWEQQVRGKADIDLTLSGHTHGFQFGFEMGNIKFSPVQLKYKRWAGLYRENQQYLYVNRGLGYLAFPGRVGIWPEITLLELTAIQEQSS